jgi:site-specific recombinase XerD
MDLAQIVKDYERSLISRNSSPRTRDAYSAAIADFLTYVQKYGVVDSMALSSEHIEGWQADMALRWGPRSRSLASTAVRQCLKWATQHEKPVKANLFMHVEAIHVPDGIAQPLALDDVTKVLKYFRSVKKQSPRILRDRALFLCLLSTGARISEVLQLRRRDLNRTSIVLQKGARPVTMTLLPPVREAIALYVATRTDTNPRVWVGINWKTLKPDPKPMTPASVRQAFHQVARAAGVPQFTTHQIRHTAATLMFNAKVPESLIADFLGHESIDSIRSYVDLASRRQEAAVTMERLLIEAEGQIERSAPELEMLAARLESVIAALEGGSLQSADHESSQVTQHLKAAIGDLRRLRPVQE